MGKVVELERWEVKARDVVVGYSVMSVDLDDLKEMFRVALKEKFGRRTVLEDGTVVVEPADETKLSKEQKLQVLDRMGYIKYLSLLKKEGVFEWL